MRPRQCLFALFAIFCLVTQAGAQQVTGRVTDQSSGQPMAAVQVSITGTGIGALSQATGRYLLLNVPVGQHTVTAQRIGYKTVTATVTVAAGSTVVQDFTLSEEALGLDEIIVTGTPGGTQRRAIGNSVLSVSAATVQETQVTADVKGLLRARTPGVTLGAGGAIGQGSDITIRGGGSFDRTRSNPIVFVDGVRVTTRTAGPSMAQGAGKSNPLDDFNPADIESVEIIKGPAAATLYGTEASAGVIQIITKKGKEGAPSFNLSVTQGVIFNRAPADKIGVEWACITGKTLPCKGITNGVVNSSAKLGDLTGVVPFSFYHDIEYALDTGTLNQYWSNQANGACGVEACWPQDNMFQYGPSYNYNLDVRGGTDNIRYFLSGNRNRDEGPTFFNWDKNNRLRANVSVVFSDQFSLDVATGFITGTTSYDAQAGQRGGTWDQAVWGSGFCSPREAIGVADPKTGVVTTPLQPGTSTPDCQRNLGFQQFLPTDQSPIISTRDVDRFTGSTTLNFKLGSWLSSRAILGVDREFDKNTWLHPVETRQANIIAERALGTLQLETPRDINTSLDVSATITKTLKGISTATSVGGQFYSKTHELFSNTGSQFASPSSTTINQTAISKLTVLYQYEENKSLGFYGQEQLGWNDRVFLTAAARFDDNSAFGTNFDPLIYPKLSGTWVMSEESFWPLAFMNEFRVRGAWGKAGRQPSTLAGVNTYGTMAGPGGSSALNPASSGNPSVGPEKSTELELGFDMAMFEGRVSGDFSWYNRTNSGNLLGVSIPASQGGGGSIQSNLGVLKNWGWEATLNVNAFKNQNVAFDLGLTGAYKMNEITDIGVFPGNNSIKIGWPYPNRTIQYTIVDAKVDPASPVVDSYGRHIQSYCDGGVMAKGGEGQDPLTSKYGLLLGGAQVKCQSMASTRTLWGPAFAPYSWTISPQMTIHNTFQITALIDASYGGVGQDMMSLWHHGGRYNTSFGSMLEDNPEYFAGYQIDQWAAMEWYARDYWKLRQIGLRYQLPDEWVRHVGGKRGSLTFSGSDLAVLWANNTGTGLHPSLEELNMPQTNILDVDFGRSADGDGGHRADPPISNFSLRFDVTF